MKVAAVRTGGRGRNRFPSKHVRFQDQRHEEKLSDDRKLNENQVSGACFIHTVSYVQASNEVCPGTKEMLKVSTSAEPSPTCNGMKTLQDVMGRKSLVSCGAPG